MEATTLKFEAWQSAVDPGFWAELARRKLETIGLSEDPVRVEALYAPASNAKVSSPAQLDRGAFADDDGSDAAVAKARDALSGGRARARVSARSVDSQSCCGEPTRMSSSDDMMTMCTGPWSNEYQRLLRVPLTPGMKKSLSYGTPQSPPEPPED